MIRKVVAGVALAVFIAGPAVAWDGSNEETEEANTKKIAEESAVKGAEARLKEAWAIKKTSFKKETAVKHGILLETVECYRSLLDEFSECHECCAEACFRMGEIYRSMKMTKKAEEEFNRTFIHDKKGEFAARSLKEIGHIHRRAKEYDAAIAYYNRVLGECPKQRSACADALTWIGKVHLKRKEYQKARDVFLGFVEKFPEFPDDAIRNIDRAAGSFLEEGNREAAASLLAEWQHHFELLLGKDKRTDRLVKKTLEGMKTPERLNEKQ